MNQRTRSNPKIVDDSLLDYMLLINLAKRELETFEDILIKEFNGRPHLGKHNTVHANFNRNYMRPQNMFPKYQKWKNAVSQLNAFGTFNNAFSANKIA